MSHCTECNSLTDSVDVCGDCQVYEIDAPEVIKALEVFEMETLADTGLKSISGGFAHADIFMSDGAFFDIELEFGVQSDCENRVDVEQYTMNKHTLEIEEA